MISKDIADRLKIVLKDDNKELLMKDLENLSTDNIYCPACKKSYHEDTWSTKDLGVWGGMGQLYKRICPKGHSRTIWG